MTIDLPRAQAALRPALTGLMAVLLSASAGAAAAAIPEAPLGNWLTEDRNAVIAIAPCGNALCGQIAGVPLAIPGEPVPTDYLNRSQCHLTILTGATPDGSDWRGRILDPRDGKVYSILLRLDKQRMLKVRGYIGIPLLGRTQTWTPFTGPVPLDCRLPPRDPPGSAAPKPGPGRPAVAPDGAIPPA